MLLMTENLTVPQMIAITVVAVVLVTIYVVVKDKINKKKAGTGEDQQAVLGILRNEVPDLGNYTTAYAKWQWETYQGNRTTTTYWYFAVAFNKERIHIVPLSFDKGSISHSAPYYLEKEDLGLINSKKGANWIEFYDKGQKEIVSLMVEGENLHDDKFHPVNIIQPDAEKAFIEWKDAWMDEVNDANQVTVTGKMKKPLKKKK